MHHNHNDYIHMFVCCLAIVGGVASMIYAYTVTKNSKNHNN